MSEINVLMFGALRSGKTSILASMMAGRNLLHTYQLKLSASDEASTFADKIVEMQDLCDSQKYKDTPRMTALMGTVDVSVFRYKLKFIDFPDAKGIDIIFHDIPGENVMQNKVVEQSVLEEIAKKCSATDFCPCLKIS